MVGGSSGRGTSRNEEEPGKLGRKPRRGVPHGYKTEHRTSPEKHGLASTHVT